MLNSKVLLPLFLTLAGSAAASRHDLYVAGAVNIGYVIGSNIVTTNGLFRRDAAGEWHHFGYNDTSIRSFTFDPRDRNVIYTAANNGCWRTLDGGKTWRITTSWDMTEPLVVTVDPNSPDTVYLALPDGVAVSSNRAQTWTRMENGLPNRGKYTQVVQVDRTKAGRVLAGCETGIYLSDNGAKKWQRVLRTDTTVDDLQQSPHDPAHWLAVTQSNGAWVSRDAGKTWQQLAVSKDGSLFNVAFDPTNAKRIALGGWNVGVLASEDGGRTWVSRNDGLPTKPQVYRVAVDPTQGRLYVNLAGEALFASDDFGRTWKREDMEGAGINCFVFLPATK
jgi:photosystem II stability/assembly factor-like uncharacterized protein